MATAKKMPSGNYRVRIYDKATGKQKSFTAETKKEAEYLANEWLTGRQKAVIKHDITVGEAVRTYIDSKNNVLSASTIRGYEIVYRNGLNGIRDINIDDLTTIQLQYWINSNAKKYSPKTLRNQFGLVTAALRQKKVRLDFEDVTLKKKTKTEIEIPTEQEIGQILRMVDGTNIELPVTLALCLGLRQSEIAALDWSDYKNDVLTINKSCVPDKNNKFILKMGNKSMASTRTLKVHGLVKERLDRVRMTSGRISPMLPSSILCRFKQLCRQNGIPEYTMHALRHANASIMLLKNIPDKYAMKQLGQSSPNMIKNVYQHIFTDRQEQVADTVSNAISEILDSKLDAKKCK